MYLGYDYRRTLESGQTCRVRVYVPVEVDDSPVIVLGWSGGERKDEPEAIDSLAADLVRQHGFQAPPLWVEHSEPGGGVVDAESFNLLCPSPVRVGDNGQQYQMPQPSGLYRQKINRKKVEELLGQRL